MLQKSVVVLVCVYLLWKIISYIWSFLNVEKEPVVVLVTGAAGMFHLFSFLHGLWHLRFYLVPIFEYCY